MENFRQSFPISHDRAKPHFQIIENSFDEHCIENLFSLETIEPLKILLGKECSNLSCKQARSHEVQESTMTGEVINDTNFTNHLDANALCRRRREDVHEFLSKRSNEMEQNIAERRRRHEMTEHF